MLRAGAGEPLLFLHGAGGWPGRLPLFEKLAAHYDVLVPEHPGFGTLENAGAIRDVADMAMYYLDFLDGLDADRIHGTAVYFGKHYGFLSGLTFRVKSILNALFTLRLSLFMSLVTGAKIDGSQSTIL